MYIYIYLLFRVEHLLYHSLILDTILDIPLPTAQITVLDIQVQVTAQITVLDMPAVRITVLGILALVPRVRGRISDTNGDAFTNKLNKLLTLNSAKTNLIITNLVITNLVIIWL